MKTDKTNLKSKLDYYYTQFDKSKISPDPLEFPRKFSNPLDIEISGFISSVFAYGNVKQIITTLNRIHTIMNWSPSKFVINYKAKSESKHFKNVKHRFYSSNDIHNFFVGLNKVYKKHGSLKNLFLENNEIAFDLKTAISRFSKTMVQYCSGNSTPSRGVIFMFPDPQKQSACKRMNLFLRWMVRKDELDFGSWNEIPTTHLLIPVDVHVARICKQLKLTKQKNVSWKMAEEITSQLKKYDALDPVKYDFAICHIGMRKLEF